MAPQLSPLPLQRIHPPATSGAGSPVHLAPAGRVAPTLGAPGITGPPLMAGAAAACASPGAASATAANIPNTRRCFIAEHGVSVGNARTCPKVEDHSKSTPVVSLR